MTQNITGLVKECNHCHQVKPLSEFHIQSKNPDGHHKTCKACRSEMRSQKLTEKKQTAEERIAALSDYQPRELIAELRRRGYKGELTYTNIIKL